MENKTQVKITGQDPDANGGGGKGAKPAREVDRRHLSLAEFLGDESVSESGRSYRWMSMNAHRIRASKEARTLGVRFQVLLADGVATVGSKGIKIATRGGARSYQESGVIDPTRLGSILEALDPVVGDMPAADGASIEAIDFDDVFGD